MGCQWFLFELFERNHYNYGIYIRCKREKRFIRKVCSYHSNPPGLRHLERPGPERRIEGKNTPVGDTPVGRAGTRKNPQPHAACRDGSPYRRWFPALP